MIQYQLYSHSQILVLMIGILILVFL